jgi:sortase B
LKKMQMFIFIIALICFLGSAGYLGKYFWERHVSAENMNDVKSLLVEETPISGETTAESDSNEILPRYARLYEENPDFAGWIQIPDTTIDYPVMYVEGDNDAYLHSNFNKEYDAAGVPFIDGYCSLEPVSDNLIIYGHHMNDNSMFQPLMNYKDADYFEAHKTINFDMLREKGTYTVVAVILSRALSEYEEGFRYYGHTSFANEEDFNDYMNNIRQLSLYDTGENAVYGDRLITLSTCEYSQEDGRLAVIAKKIN